MNLIISRALYVFQIIIRKSNIILYYWLIFNMLYSKYILIFQIFFIHIELIVSFLVILRFFCGRGGLAHPDLLHAWRGSFHPALLGGEGENKPLTPFVKGEFSTPPDFVRHPSRGEFGKFFFSILTTHYSILCKAWYFCFACRCLFYEGWGKSW